jgi:outer membrane protein TolC
MKYGRGVFLFLFAAAVSLSAAGQQRLTLTLGQAIVIAADSSLASSSAKSTYLEAYWQYRAYKAARLPSLSLTVTPAEYYRNITKRYDSENNVDVYRSQQYYDANGGLNITQNFDLLGGTFYLNSSLDYLRNFGSEASTQFTSVPIEIGYNQSLFGYNQFKWDKKIEPLKYETARRQLAYDMEGISAQTTTYFFALALAQTNYDVARQNLASADTLYRIGQERQKIVGISRADLQTLQLDAINARNSLKNAEISLQQAMHTLASYLGYDRQTQLRVVLPSRPPRMTLSADEALQAARANNPTLLDLHRQVLTAEENVDKTLKQSRFNASVNADIGFNQVAANLKGAYRNPSQQDIVAVTVSIPLVDWGVRKGNLNTARSTLNVTRATAKQQEIQLEEDVITTVANFNVQQDIIASTEEALDLADQAYAETRQRFIVGQADMSALTLAQQRWQDAETNYVEALSNYQSSYYKLRQLTLYDFELHRPLSSEFGQ